MQTDGNVFSKIGLVKEENSKLRQRVFSSSLVVGNDAATKFYTGIPSYGVFVLLFTFLSPYVNAPWCLSKDDEYFLTLVKLRLNLLFQDLAYRFGISVSSISTIFQKWLDVMFVRLQFLIS